MIRRGPANLGREWTTIWTVIWMFYPTRCLTTAPSTRFTLHVPILCWQKPFRGADISGHLRHLSKLFAWKRKQLKSVVFMWSMVQPSVD
jgi:hypothetical protein